MAEKSTWVKIDRNILEWEWYKNVNTFKLFLHLIIKANIKPARFEGVEVRRGQLVTSYATLAAETGLSYKSVRTALNHLKRTGEVAVVSYNSFSLITVEKYDLYQDRRADQRAGQGQTKGRRRAGEGQQSNNSIMEEERIKKDASLYDHSWESKYDIPDRYKGRFNTELEWKRFIGEDETYGQV